MLVVFNFWGQNLCLYNVIRADIIADGIIQFSYLQNGETLKSTMDINNVISIKFTESEVKTNAPNKNL